MADILGEQSRTSVVLRKAGEPAEDLPGIQVFGAATDWDLSDIGRQLGPKGVRLPAGCAGFAAVVTDLLALEDAVLQRDPVAGKELPHCGHRERKYSPDAAVGGRVAGVSAAEVGSGGSVRVQRQLLPPVFQRAHGHTLNTYINQRKISHAKS